MTVTIKDVKETLRKWGRRCRATYVMDPEAHERAKARMLRRCPELQRETNSEEQE